MSHLFAEWLFPIVGPPIHWGVIRWQGNTFQQIGGLDTALKLGLYEGGDIERIQSECAGRVIFPGFINLHAHLEQSYPDCIPRRANEDFVDWLLKVVRISKEGESGSLAAQGARTQWGIEESLKSGVTYLADISRSGESAALMQQSGLNGFVALEFFHPGPLQQGRLGPLMSLKTRYEALHQCYSDSGLRIGLSPHSLYNVSPSAWHWLQKECQSPWVHTHLAESKLELAWLQKKAGTANTPIDRLHQSLLDSVFQPDWKQAKVGRTANYLAEQGLLSEKLLVAHGVELEGPERRLLNEHCVGLAHCPRSNLALHARTLSAQDWDAMRYKGLGSDGRLSTPTLSMMDEACAAASLHRWSWEETLRAITLEPAKALKLDSKIGSLNPGKQADFSLWILPKASTAGGPAGIATYFKTSQAATCQQVWTRGLPRLPSS